jgi:uncharacterized membrane protein
MWWALVNSGAFLTALWLPQRAGWGQIPPQGWLCVGGSCLAHGLYLTFLIEAYDKGDLSIVYPLARSAPIFLVVWAVLFLGERFTSLGLAGIVVVIVGLYLLQVGESSLKGYIAALQALGSRPAQLALMAALFLSFGSVIDKVGVGLVHPFLYAVLFMNLVALFLTVRLLGRRSFRDLAWQWLSSKRRLLVVGLLGVPSYALVLVAMNLSQVSYVIAARQVSVVFGVMLGIWLLRERHGRVRLVASAVICLGVVMIGLA